MRRARAAGFTLIELLVVIFIIGLVATGAFLSLGGNGRDSQLEQERDRLSGLIDYVRERAALQTVEYGLRFQQDGYQFVMYDSRQDQWTLDPLDDTLRARALPAGLDFQLKVEDKAIVLPQRPAPGSAAAKAADAAAAALKAASATPATTLNAAIASAASAASTAGSSMNVPTIDATARTAIDLTPQVMLFSNGDVTSFKLTLERAASGRSALISSTPANKIEVNAIVEPVP